MTATWVRPIEEAFEQQFGLRGVRSKVSLAIPHQTHLTHLCHSAPPSRPKSPDFAVASGLER